MHVEGDASSASYFIARRRDRRARRGAAAHRRRGQRFDPGRHPLRRRRRADGRAHRAQRPTALEVQRGQWPLRGITLDCNHMPDAAMTLAAMALYADGPTRLTGIASWRVKETDRIAAMAAELRKLGAGVVAGDDFIEVTPPAPALARRRHPHLRRPPHGDVPVAGGVQPAGAPAAPTGRCPVRILDPNCVAKTFPDYFEPCSASATRRPGDVPVITIDGPTASGKGTLAGARGRRAGLPPARFRRAVPRHRAGRRSGTASRPTTCRRWPACAGCWTCASATARGQPRLAARARGQRRAARRKPRPAGLARVGPRPGAPGAARPAAGLSPRARAGGRRARHGHRRSSPTRRSRCSSPRAPPARRTAA